MGVKLSRSALEEETNKLEYSFKWEKTFIPFFCFVWTDFENVTEEQWDLDVARICTKLQEICLIQHERYSSFSNSPVIGTLDISGVSENENMFVKWVSLLALY